MHKALDSIIKAITFHKMNEDDRRAWKGFLIGIIIGIVTFIPVIILILIFVFGEYNNFDDMLLEHLKNLFGQ